MHPKLDRRRFLAAPAIGATLCGWLGRIAAAAPVASRPKSCILLWMAGGPSHLDTFDLKPDAPEQIRGEFQPIETSVPGIQISEHFPRLARLMQHAAVLRGMSTVESDHKLATYHLHTGYLNRAGAVSFPSLGAIAAAELGKGDVPLPNFVCIGRGPQEALTAGFLGPQRQPLAVSDAARGLDFIQPIGSRAEFDRQAALLQQFETAFDAKYKSGAAQSHRTAVSSAVRLMNSEQKRALDLSLEPERMRSAYSPPAGSVSAGKKGAGQAVGKFGQGCLLARRLVEAGVPFVEVVMGEGADWDTHRDNFPRTRALSLECDIAMAALIEDLQQRGLLETTLVVWMGEFGRTPQCAGGGRNHWAKAWSSVVIGGGIQGGQVIGRTDRDAAAVIDRPITVPDFLATVCTILGIDHTRRHDSPELDRPISIVDSSKEVKLIRELL
jgi:uncharacterized protein (DUF1501 family)